MLPFVRLSGEATSLPGHFRPGRVQFIDNMKRTVHALSAALSNVPAPTVARGLGTETAPPGGTRPAKMATSRWSALDPVGMDTFILHPRYSAGVTDQGGIHQQHNQYQFLGRTY